MGQSDNVLTVKCSERDGPVVRHVRETKLSIGKLRFLFDKLSQFDTLFNDYTKGDFDSFLQKFLRIECDGNLTPIGLIWEVDDVGILFLTDFNTDIGEAYGHFTFWDRIYRGRADLCRRMIEYVFEDLNLRVLRTDVPLYAKPTLFFVEALGFHHDGRFRSAVPYREQWFDVNHYSILREEAIGNGTNKTNN